MGHTASLALDDKRTPGTPKCGFMVHEILTPQDRPVRLRLQEWAALRLRDFENLKQSSAYDEPAICGAIVDCFNEAALIEVYYGRLVYAAGLCNAAMQWVDHLVKTSGSAACYRFAVQPYINLGRLDRIAKHWQESLDKFKVAEEVSKGNPVAFGPILLDESSLEQMAKQFPDAKVLQNIFILDTLKTLLKAAWYDRVLNYFPGWETSPNPLHRDFIREASLVALTGLHEYDQALELTEKHLRNSQSTNRLVFLYRRAEILVAAGESQQAKRIMENVAAAFEAYSRGLTLNKLIVLAALCRMMVRTGFSEVGPLLSSGVAAASKLGDVLLERDFLQMLAQVNWPQNSNEHMQRNVYTLHGTGLYNAAHSPGTEGSETIHMLSERLLNFAGYQMAIPPL